MSNVIESLKEQLAAAREEISRYEKAREGFARYQKETAQRHIDDINRLAAEKARADKAEERVRELVAILQTLKQRGFTTATWDLVEAAIKRVSDLEELLVSKRTNVRALAKEAEAIFLARQEQKDGGR